MAAATACSDACSTPPAYRSRSARVTPLARHAPTMIIRPVVTVPVLSKTTTPTDREDSRARYPLMNTPSRAPRPQAITSAAGVARPSAHGHAMISTDSAALTARPAGSPASSQPARVRPEQPRMAGTNTPQIRSAVRCAADFWDWARSTIASSRASRVSAPARVTPTISRPVSATIPAVTSSPSAASPGTDSPVIALRSMAASPNATTPSAAMVSPGRTTSMSPGRSWLTGT